MNSTPCNYCDGTGTEMKDRSVYVNDRRALLEELRHLVMNHGASGLESPNVRQRLRAHTRVSWLSSRIVWLETEELLNGGTLPPDNETTGEMMPIKNCECAQAYKGL